MNPFPPSPGAAEAMAAFRANPGLLTLQGTVQHYDWGGFHFIPSLLGIDNRERRPFAELWMGTHPNGPALARLGPTCLSLAQLMGGAAVEILGAPTASRFSGHLPYLFKVLDARDMLSIQAHPTRQQAVEGFEREEAAGIPWQSPQRNYRDRNHKPEVHVALTHFWMLHGFRYPAEMEALLGSVPELRPFTRGFTAHPSPTDRKGGSPGGPLQDLYYRIMTMPQEEVDSILNPLIARLKTTNISDKEDPGYWVLRAAEGFHAPGGHRDRGIFCFYLLNLIHLRPGQGTFQPAGTLHAYLEGTNIELMANSDNVLRGGLTRKHVDVPELMRILRFAGSRPEILEGESLSETETAYRTPAEEFELSCLRVVPNKPYASRTDHSADTLIVLEGGITAKAGRQLLVLRRGDILLAPHGAHYVMESRGDPAWVYKAAVPQAVRS